MWHLLKPRNRLVLYAGVFIVCAAVSVFAVVGDRTLVRSIAREDSVIEMLTAFFFFCGAIASWFAFRQHRYATVSLFWCAICLVFLGEETSWFQRQIGYSVPLIEQRNAQSEFNFHNLAWIQSGGQGNTYLTTDGKLNFTWDKLFQSQTIFRIGFLSYFLLLPILLYFNALQPITKRIDIPTVPVALIILIWATIGVSALLTFMSGAEIRRDLTEIRELYFALFIFLYTLTMLKPSPERS